MCQAAMTMACSTETSARIGPRRAVIRWYFAQKYVFFRFTTESAAIPKAPLRYRSPGRVLVDFTLPADSFDPGQTPHHDARCCAVGKTLISAPVSAMNTSGDDPGYARNAHQQLPGAPKGLHRRLDPSVQAGDVGVVCVDPVQEQPGHESMVVTEPPGQRLGQRGDLRTHPRLHKLRDRRRILLAVDQRLQHRPC